MNHAVIFPVVEVVFLKMTFAYVLYCCSKNNYLRHLHRIPLNIYIDGTQGFSAGFNFLLFY